MRPTGSRMGRAGAAVTVLALAAALTLGLALALGAGLTSGAASAADDEFGISGAERKDPGVVLNVAVPEGVQVDLGGVSATIDGEDYETEARLIKDSATRVTRTTVLAIDISKSMTGARFTAAKAAARTFLESAPTDVLVGIVTFDKTVEVALEPTTDREAALDVVDGLRVATVKDTQLFDGIEQALTQAGDDGQRSVLVISDGEDTSGALPDEIAAEVAESGVDVGVVALDQSESALAILEEVAGDRGAVLDASAEALTAEFAAEAEILNRQIAVAITAPAEAVSEDKSISISITLPLPEGEKYLYFTLPALSGGEVVTDPASTIPVVLPPSADDGNRWVIYAGSAVFGLGLFAIALALVPAKPKPLTAEARISDFLSGGLGPISVPKESHTPPVFQQMADALGRVLERHRTLDRWISVKLDAAGSELRSSEWALLSIGIFLISSAFGALAGQGDPVVILLFMIIGALGPIAYLSMRISRQRRAFDAVLPETLNLMAGSLTAGLSFVQAIDAIVREGLEPVASAFGRVLVETRIGVSLDDALERVADRYDSRDFHWVVMAIRIQRQVGGNLAELLTTVATTMREREFLRRQVNGLAAEGRLSALILGALPPLFLTYMLIARRDYILPLFTDPRGLVMIIGAAIWLCIGIFWMSRIARVEV